MEEDLTQEKLEGVLINLAPYVRFLRQTDSSNRVAMEWAREGAPEGSIVVADYQTAGRGRMGRTWFAPRGTCLLFSLILRPNLAADDLAIVNLAAGCATAGTMVRYGFDPRLKWPNDLNLSGKKTVGILAESEIEIGRALSVVLGIGMNVNVDAADFPKEIAATATSLKIEGGGDYDRLEILGAFITYWGELYMAISEGHLDRIVDLYRPLCETIGRQVRVQLGERTVEGRAVNIDPTGGLVLESGEVLRSGEVVHVR